jgi:MYXO-CTERM domain-containing protein
MKTSLSCVFVLAFAVTACGGDKGGGSAPDATGGMGGTGGTDGAGGTGGGNTTVQFQTEVSLDVPGFENAARVTTALADGATVQWELTSAPGGSQIDQDALTGADTEEVTFIPDLGGDYVFEVTVRSGGTSATETVTVTPPTYDIPFIYSAVSDDTGSTQVARMIKSGGEAVRDVGCTFGVAGVTPEDWSQEQVFTEFSLSSLRLQMPETVQGVARIASTFVAEEGEEGAGLLQISSSNTRCTGTNQPVEITEIRQHSWTMAPRFSPGGERMVIVNDGTTDDTLVTFSLDNSEKRVIKTWAGGINTIPDGGMFDDGVSTHATWLDPTHVAWIDKEPDEAFRVLYSAADTAGAGDSPTTVMSCEGVPEGESVLKASQFEIVGDVIYTAAQGSLWRIEKGEGGAYSCSTGAATNLNITGDIVGVDEFQVDPFGQRVVFAASQDTGETYNVYLVPADGSSPPTRISPLDGARHRGPHWSLAGRQVVWASIGVEVLPVSGQEEVPEPNTFQSPSLAQLFRANANGSQVTVIWRQEAPGRAGVRAHTGRNSGFSCALGLGAPQVPGLLSVVGLGGLWALRRRRQRAA